MTSISCNLFPNFIIESVVRLSFGSSGLTVRKRSKQSSVCFAMSGLILSLFSISNKSYVSSVSLVCSGSGLERFLGLPRALFESFGLTSGADGELEFCGNSEARAEFCGNSGARARLCGSPEARRGFEEEKVIRHKKG